MARKLTAQQLFDGLLDRYGLELAAAFQAAINDLRSAADLQRVITALDVGDIEGALAALNLEPAAYSKLLDSVQQGFSAGGEATVVALPAFSDATGARVVVRFDGRSPRAEAWLRDYSSDLVTRIVEDQRTAVRAALVGGMERGAAPRTVGLDVVGRINPASGLREGGILGLSAPQEAFVRTARGELASGDPEALRHYLTRTRRDRRFDRTIQKAINNGTAVPADIQRKAVSRYTARLLELRGQMIGRTEAMTSLHAGQDEALRQAVDRGAVTGNQVRRVWRSASDAKVRDTHRALNGDSVGLNEPFTSPSGAALRFPGDPRAPASERIGCRCTLSIRIDSLANIR